MNISLNFFSNKNLQTNEFKQYICLEFSKNETDIIFLNEDTFDYIERNNKWDEYNYGENIYVVFKELIGEHFCWVQVEGKHVSVEEQVNFLKNLCKSLNCSCITSDEGLDPFAWVLINQDGEVFSIDLEINELDENNTVLVCGYNNKTIGSFATIEEINLDEILNLISEICNIRENIIEIEEYEAKFHDVDNNYKFIEFTHNNNLKIFKYRYYLKFNEIPKWYSKLKGSEKWTEIMQEFSERSKKEVCIFHEYFSKTINIPGGSDSEEYCLYLKDKYLEKILFKKAREKW